MPRAVIRLWWTAWLILLAVIIACRPVPVHDTPVWVKLGNIPVQWQITQFDVAHWHNMIV